MSLSAEYQGQDRNPTKGSIREMGCKSVPPWQPTLCGDSAVLERENGLEPSTLCLGIRSTQYATVHGRPSQIRFGDLSSMFVRQRLLSCAQVAVRKR